MDFIVNIDFKRGPSFRINVSAQNKDDAIMIAKREAVGCGLDEPVKRAAAYPV